MYAGTSSNWGPQVQWRLLDRGRASVNVSVPAGAEGAELVVPCVTPGAAILNAQTGQVLWRDGAPAPTWFGDGAAAAVLSTAPAPFSAVALQLGPGNHAFERTAARLV